MTSYKHIVFTVPEVDLNFRARLLAEDSPDVVAQVERHLPLYSALGHVVISGEAIWIPTRIVYLGRTHMVKRSPGAVYLYAPGQTICITYGRVTESALVNKFGQVIDEDLPKLRALGEHVWNRTVARPRRNVVKITVGGAA
jgi:hypothetical protein